MRLSHETKLLSSFFWWPFLQCLLCELEQEWNSLPPKWLVQLLACVSWWDKASRSPAALTVSVWGMSQILVSACCYDSKHTTPGSTKIAERSGAMVNTPCPSLLPPLKTPLSTLLSHAGTVLSLAQEQEEGLEANLFVCFQKYDVYRVILHSKKCEKWRRLSWIRGTYTWER